jgi:hypothetical protein
VESVVGEAATFVNQYVVVVVVVVMMKPSFLQWEVSSWTDHNRSRRKGISLISILINCYILPCLTSMK